uniref:Uncharacterized protein n=1 Tax=Siphoviridae sp. ctX581 TaxID=2826365 RepID=A0A8S5MDM5_9CAUD|nr:MAG TPA: hypothetical protein [Siphoviridae sp. ctX581]
MTLFSPNLNKNCVVTNISIQHIGDKIKFIS